MGGTIVARVPLSSRCLIANKQDTQMQTMLDFVIDASMMSDQFLSLPPASCEWLINTKLASIRAVLDFAPPNWTK